MDPDVVHWIPVVARAGGKILKAPHSLKGTRGTDEHTEKHHVLSQARVRCFLCHNLPGGYSKKNRRIPKQHLGG